MTSGGTVNGTPTVYERLQKLNFSFSPSARKFAWLGGAARARLVDLKKGLSLAEKPLLPVLPECL